MSRKRVGVQLDFEKSEKRSRETCEEAVHVTDDLDKDSTSSSSSLQLMLMSILENFVRAGNQTAVLKLLAKQELDLDTLKGVDLLWTAYALGNNEIAWMLVHYGADLCVRKHTDERTLLHHMLRGTRIRSTVTRNLFCLMLDVGADIDARDNEGSSLLHDAITSSHEGSTELVKELLKRGARLTVDKGNRQKDDIFLTIKHKIELLPKIILHQAADKKTRDWRATLAMMYLVSVKYTDDEETAAAMRMIEKILELGVSVNVPKSQRSKWKLSFLGLALQNKNIAAVEVLLNSGADPHVQSSIGHTTLYLATGFKETTQVSRWLIERGVSIEARNLHGDYSIHGACKSQSVKNLHLLLNLGADLNSTDNDGKTPYEEIPKRDLKSTEVSKLVIKHFALMIARGKKISEKDKVNINKCGLSQNHFECCTKQLDLMKKLKVHNETSYFFLLSTNTFNMLQLMKDRYFLKNFTRDQSFQVTLFPDYFDMLIDSLGIAQKKLGVFLTEKRKLCNVFRGSMPEYAVDKIAFNVSLEKFANCHQEYYMSFHAANDFKIEKQEKQ